AGLLVRSGAVAPLDPALFHHADEYLEPFRDGTAGTTLGGERTYGTPALYGPNALLYDAQEVDPAPKSWSAVFDPAVPYGGRIALRDTPMEIAIAAMWLARHRPELGIVDPYELTSEQLDAATT